MHRLKNIGVGLGIFLAVFVLLETVLFFAGIRPSFKDTDPYVGFSAYSPLFMKRDTLDASHFVTAPAKLKLFNKQVFPQKKSSDTYRIFTLGGSTTYGRPYNDKTSFSRWLREFLPREDESKNWEVINAGGISYASYRVTRLMEELIQYKPDLFIIYSGHNEFLEERTYRKLKEIPPAILALTELLEKTRAYSGMKKVMEAVLFTEKPSDLVEKKYQMKSEVETLLDNSIGPQSFTRNDSLEKNITGHYKLSLQRMVDLARSVGAEVLLINTPSNVKDCSPFKSDFSHSLPKGTKARLYSMMQQADTLNQKGDFRGALVLYEKVLAEDPRYAEALYQKGKMYLNLKNYNGASEFLHRALEEDICQLRAPQPFSQIVREVSKENTTAFLDWSAALMERNQQTLGHNILGNEYFLDHVHLTVDAHRLLAERILEQMMEQGWAKRSGNFTAQEKAELVEKINRDEANPSRGVALHYIAKVFNWAGKHEDAENIAEKALQLDSTHVETFTSSLIVGAKYHRQEKWDKAMQFYKKAYAIDSNNADLNRFMGLIFEKQKSWDKALKHFHLYMSFDSEDVVVHQSLAHVNYELEKYEQASRHYAYLLQRSPRNSYYRYHLGKCWNRMGRPDLAEQEWRRVLQLNPGHLEARQSLQKRSKTKKTPLSQGAFSRQSSPAQKQALEKLKEKLKEKGTID